MYVYTVDKYSRAISHISSVRKSLMMEAETITETLDFLCMSEYGAAVK
jgi:hypothetical protein